MSERIDRLSTDQESCPLSIPASGVAACALLAIVAAASAGNAPSLPLRVGFIDRHQLILLAAAIALAVLAAAFTVTLVMHRARYRRVPEARLSHSLLRVAPFTAALVGILCLAAITRVQMHADQEVRTAPDIQRTGARPRLPLGTTDGRSSQVVASDSDDDDEEPSVTASAEHFPERTPVVRLLLATVLVALLFLSSGAWLAYRLRPRAAESGDEIDDTAVHDALLATIDTMLADPNPKTAVIGAYARLLENLADCGFARHEHEAPLEHMRRTLESVHVPPEPVGALIDLFERARFSSQAVTPAHRTQALQALRDAAHYISPIARARQEAASIA